MITVLVAVILLLILVIIWLNVSFYKERELFQSRLAHLQRVIVEVSQKQSGQQEQLQLSDELDEVLNASKSMLSEEIFSLNRDIFELLSKNNLLKK